MQYTLYTIHYTLYTTHYNVLPPLISFSSHCPPHCPTTHYTELRVSLIRNGNQNVWLGLNDVASEGTFVCQGSMTSTYTDWNDG
jgi:hypothetical protein